MTKSVKIILAVSVCIVLALALFFGLFYGTKPTVTLDYGFSTQEALWSEPELKFEDINVIRGSIYAPTRPERSGYEFQGWYKDSALMIPWLSNERVYSDITLYAKWQKIE